MIVIVIHTMMDEKMLHSMVAAAVAKERAKMADEIEKAVAIAMAAERAKMVALEAELEYERKNTSKLVNDAVAKERADARAEVAALKEEVAALRAELRRERALRIAAQDAVMFAGNVAKHNANVNGKAADTNYPWWVNAFVSILPYMNMRCAEQHRIMSDMRFVH